MSQINITLDELECEEQQQQQQQQQKQKQQKWFNTNTSEVNKNTTVAETENNSNNRNNVTKRWSITQPNSHSEHLNDKLSKYQFHSLHEELTFLRNEWVNFQRRSQLQYAENKRLKEELKHKVHELHDCKEKLKAYEVQEEIEECNFLDKNSKKSIDNNNSRKSTANSKSMLEQQQQQEQIVKDHNKLHSDVNNNVSEERSNIKQNYSSRAKDKVTIDLRRSLAERDSALHELQLRNIELDTAREKLAREVERVQHELLSITEERNTQNNTLLNKDREIERLSKQLVTAEEQIVKRTEEMERLRVRNTTYELLLNNNDDLCFAVGSPNYVEPNQSEEEELHYKSSLLLEQQEEQCKESKEQTIQLENYHKVNKDKPASLYAKRLPSHFSKRSNTEVEVIHSVLQSHSLMFKQRIREMQTELKSVKNHEEQLLAEVETKQQTIDEYSKRIHELQNECLRVQTDADYHKEQVMLLQNKLEVLNKEIINNDNNSNNNNNMRESYAALMKLNRSLQRKLADAQEALMQHTETHANTDININATIMEQLQEQHKSCSDIDNNQVNSKQWSNAKELETKYALLQRENAELKNDNTILARAAELLCASHTQQQQSQQQLQYDQTILLLHSKLKNAEQSIHSLLQRLNVVRQENVEYETLIAKIADTVPVQTILCKSE